MAENSPAAGLNALRDELKALETQLQDPDLFADPQRAAALARRHRSIEEVVGLDNRRQTILGQIEENTALSHEGDAEMRALAAEENKELEAELAAVEKNLEDLLLPEDPDADKNAVLEIRAGTGGDEAELFAAELLRSYTRFCEKRGWKIEIANLNSSSLGGVKEAIATIEGDQVFKYLRFESGVHRVQRVPETEKMGRVHTSAATVAILPEAQETDVDIKDNDLRIDVFRSGGNGGQSVNTTDSAVRITHLPTGLIVTCQDEKSQHKNKAKAMSVLRSRLYEAERERLQKERKETRLSQIGSGDRSEKVRTYNFPQDRVTDHRINQSFSNLPSIMNGELEPIIDGLLAAEREEKRAALTGNA